MDSNNLIEFNSPNTQEKSENCLEVNLSTSPGNNPFDSLCRHINHTVNIPKIQTSPQFTEHFFDFDDVGKEQFLGLKNLDISGRESLGILKLETLNSSFGILNVSPRINIDLCEKSKDFDNSPLNTAFLHHRSNSRRSALSSGSSALTNPSQFNSESLDASEPSNIYSVNFGHNFDVVSNSEDVLNDAFLKTFSSELKISNNSVSTSSLHLETVAKVKSEQDLKGDASRIRSLPNYKITEAHEEKQLCSNDTDAVGYELNLQEADDSFNDSVFIEANHLASKLADGSLMITNQSLEEHLLDCTSPPDFEDLEENECTETQCNTETVFKVIDKMLPVQQDTCNEINPTDTMNLNTDIINPLNKPNEFKHNLSRIFNTTSKKSRHSSSSSGSSKSKDANELLHNLSAIINNECRDSKQNIEGQQLLFSLADILCSGSSKLGLEDKTDNLEDSGHSSIEQEEQQNDEDLYECYEVLDLRLTNRASKSEDNEQVLDLSMKAKEQNTIRRLSQSFSFPSPKLPKTKLFTRLNNRTTSVSSVSSGENKAGPDSVKLKPKKVENKSFGFKKGPLKAVIPLGNMSKRRSLCGKLQSVSVTPPKTEQSSSSIFKVKKTSTPIAEPELKPIAQSTPDALYSAVNKTKPISCSSQLKKRKFYCPVSPLVRPNSIGDSSTNKSSCSNSTPNLSKDSSISSPKSMYRRHSASELKASKEPITLKRSYSIGVDHKTPTMIDKLKKSISKSSNVLKEGNTNLSKSSAVCSNRKSSTFQERNRGITSNIKAFGVLGNLKKSIIGKENHIKKNRISEK